MRFTLSRAIQSTWLWIGRILRAGRVSVPAGARPAGREDGRHMSDSISEPSEEQIADLARKYWEEEGQPEGKAEEHWKRAQNQLRNEASKPRASDKPVQQPAAS